MVVYYAIFPPQNRDLYNKGHIHNDGRAQNFYLHTGLNRCKRCKRVNVDDSYLVVEELTVSNAVVS